MTLSGGTLQLLRRATLSPNSAPLRRRCQKAPAQIEKARRGPRSVTPGAEGARRGAAPRLARHSGSVTRAPRRTRSGRAPAGRGGSDARSGPRAGHQRECRLLHPGRPAPGAGAGNFQAGQVPVRPQGTRAQEKGISHSDLGLLSSAALFPGLGTGKMRKGRLSCWLPADCARWKGTQIVARKSHELSADRGPGCGKGTWRRGASPGWGAKGFLRAGTTRNPWFPAALRVQRGRGCPGLFPQMLPLPPSPPPQLRALRTFITSFLQCAYLRLTFTLV